jgi:branched-chain amino acid transport system substrate-binding protein
MKRIAFLVVASLMVMGLVLPGCGGGGGGGGGDTRPAITIAIADAMTDITGENAWNGATMAEEEINAGAGINVGGVYHKVALVKVDTNEVVGTPDQGVTALQSVIDDADIVLGGFRTENLLVYREVAMDAKKLFMDCGAATCSLTYSVETDYDTYKYFFRVTPYNDDFLVTSFMKMTSTAGTLLKNALLAEGDAVDPDYQVTADSKLRVAVLMENAAWCEGMVDAANAFLPGYGFSIVGTWLVSPTATDISTELAQIEAKKPHIIFVAFSGPVGEVYSKQKGELGIPAMTIGTNVPGALKAHWTNSGGAAQGELYLDTWAEGAATGPKAVDFFNKYVAEFNDYPGYTAITYDEIYALKAAIEAVSAANGYTKIADVVKPANIDHLIQYLETTKWSDGVSTPAAYYPVAAIDQGAGKYALSEEQVRALYPSLGTYVKAQWQAYYTTLANTPIDAVGHLAHDLVYGPGYATGIGAQWQNGHKVCVWPVDLGADYDEALTDQHGNWNFQYPGTVAMVIPIDGFLAS